MGNRFVRKTGVSEKQINNTSDMEYEPASELIQEYLQVFNEQDGYEHNVILHINNNPEEKNDLEQYIDKIHKKLIYAPKRRDGSSSSCKYVSTFEAWGNKRITLAEMLDKSAGIGGPIEPINSAPMGSVIDFDNTPPKVACNGLTHGVSVQDLGHAISYRSAVSSLGVSSRSKIVKENGHGEVDLDDCKSEQYSSDWEEDTIDHKIWEKQWDDDDDDVELQVGTIVEIKVKDIWTKGKIILKNTDMVWVCPETDNGNFQLFNISSPNIRYSLESSSVSRLKTVDNKSVWATMNGIPYPITLVVGEYVDILDTSSTEQWPIWREGIISYQRTADRLRDKQFQISERKDEHEKGGNKQSKREFHSSRFHRERTKEVH